MIATNDKLYADLEAVNRIPMVPTMLEVICRTTGMGFACIARVTKDRWLACSVRDEVQFGLEAGGELKVETTLCDEIRDSHQAIVIDDVITDPVYAGHHTPKLYGLQSYISFPIILKNGEFFGTLCAIDPKPADLNNPKILGMFALFVELLTFHLDSLDLMDRSRLALQETSRQLEYYMDENRQYQYISNHHLQEPLRKIRIFSDFLVTNTEISDVNKAREIALKINSFAKDITGMIRDLTDFSGLSLGDNAFEPVDLNKTLLYVCSELILQLEEKKAIVNNDVLPVVHAIPAQMAQLFAHLVGNSLKFSKPGVLPVIKVYSRNIAPEDINDWLLAKDRYKYCEIIIEDNGIGIASSQLESIYDIFVRSAPKETNEGFGAGLAYCRKIVHNHGGMISTRSTLGEGTSFSIVLPVDR